MVQMLIAYIVLGLVYVFSAVIYWLDAKDVDTAATRVGAILVLLSPVWPVPTVALIIRGLYALVRTFLKDAFAR